MMIERSHVPLRPRKASRGRPRKAAGSLPSADQMRRLKFIERAALWTGQVGRRAVATTFDVSVGHVTSDFQRYREMAPDNLSYDVGEKCFRPTNAFEPIFGPEDPANVLNTVAATATLSHQDRARLLGFDLSVDAVQALPMAIDQTLLVSICRSITAGSMLEIDYQSMSTPDPVRRTFAPHALIFTGQRWLTRGWDGRHEEFRDIALARILRTGVVQSIDDLPRDAQWHDRVSIDLVPRDNLSSGQRAVTAREFGMQVRSDGTVGVTINPRQAMVPYILDQYRLRPSDATAQALPIRLVDYAAIQRFDRRSQQV